MAKEDKSKQEPETKPDLKPELCKKLTTKGVMGDRVSSADVKDGPVQLYSIIGICNGFKTGSSQYGDWVGFTGQFEAQRFADGQRFVAPVSFIPEPASGMMLSALEQANKRGEEANLQFAFIIGAKKSNAAIGFEYTVEPVLKASQNDMLAELRNQIAPRLPAPSTK